MFFCLIHKWSSTDKQCPACLISSVTSANTTYPASKPQESKEFVWTDELVDKFVRERIISPSDYLHTQLTDRLNSFKASKQSPSPKEVSKDWEILTGYSRDAGVHPWNEGGRSCEAIGCSINSVKRLSDGEVFAFGDMLEYKVGDEPWIVFWDGEIRKIEVKNDRLQVELYDPNYKDQQIHKFIENIRHKKSKDKQQERIEIGELEVDYGGYKFYAPHQFPQETLLKIKSAIESILNSSKP